MRIDRTWSPLQLELGYCRYIPPLFSFDRIARPGSLALLNQDSSSKTVTVFIALPAATIGSTAASRPGRVRLQFATVPVRAADHDWAPPFPSGVDATTPKSFDFPL